MPRHRLVKYVGISVLLHLAFVLVVAFVVILGRVLDVGPRDGQTEQPGASATAAQPTNALSPPVDTNDAVAMPERPDDIELFGKGE